MGRFFQYMGDNKGRYIEKRLRLLYWISLKGKEIKKRKNI